jgi:Holliday junction resolvasome RuvABC endonuclease subunit
MGQRPVVLGCDPGDRNTAFGVMGDGVILHSSLLYRASTPWDAYCVTFQDEMTRLLKIYAVNMVAVESFVWYGEYAKVEPPIRELIGITRTFSRTIPVEVIEAKVWSQAITGTKPAKGTGFDRNRLWKSAIRAALSRRLQLMDIDLDAVVGKDHGNHRTDALALALFCQDWAHIHSHERR